MSNIIAKEVHTKTQGEVRNVSVSFVGMLDAGELLTGIPIVAEVGTSDLTITSPAVNTAQLTILGKNVEIGQAVTFSVSGGDPAVFDYQIGIIVSTDATPAQTIVRRIRINVEP